MGLDFSQKRLVSAPMRSHSKRAKRLRLYAFFTGVLSMLVSLAAVLIDILKH